MLDTVELRLTIPPGLGHEADVLCAGAQIRAKLLGVEICATRGLGAEIWLPSFEHRSREPRQRAARRARGCSPAK